MSESDEHYIRAYLEGDENSLNALIKRNIKTVYSFVFHVVGDTNLAEDITQETFVKVWKNIKKYNINKKFKSWIFSIARNTAIDFMRKRKDSIFSDYIDQHGKNSFEENLTDEEPLADEVFLNFQNIDEIKNNIQKLQPIYKEVLFLHYNEELTFDEISTILKCSPNTVRSRHKRAVDKLKEMHQN